MTSSKISRAPASSQARRRPARNPSTGGTRPMLAATGSTMTHATCSSRSGTRLYGATTVSDTAAAGTPAESGSPSVATPLPHRPGARRNDRDSNRRTSRSGSDRCGRVPDGRRSWPPRSPKTPAEPGHNQRHASRLPRPTSLRPRSARRRWSLGWPRRPQPAPRSGGCARVWTPRTTARSRGAGCHRRPTRRRPHPG